MENITGVEETTVKNFKCIKICTNLKDNRDHILRAETETEYQEWLKEIKQSFQQAQVMMRAGAKIMSSGHRYVTQYSKDENGPITS